MPTEPDAAASAAAEAAGWMGIADAFGENGALHGLDDTAPSEAAAVGFFDPGADLEQRGRAWGYQFEKCDLADVARFAAGLAAAEADAWRSGPPDIATRAYADRRFLLSDRALHWAVPWLDATGRCYPHRREAAHGARDTLLALGDRHRPAPDLASGEGLYPPGHDAFGPTDELPLPSVIGSLWSGAVVLRATLRSITGRDLHPAHLASAQMSEVAEPLSYFYGIAAARWQRLGAEHAGSAGLWGDLALRARQTEQRLAAS